VKVLALGGLRLSKAIPSTFFTTSLHGNSTHSNAFHPLLFFENRLTVETSIYTPSMNKNFISVEDLRTFHKEQFVRLAYKMVLDREPDMEGLIHWPGHLCKNISPAEFLNELRRNGGSAFKGPFTPGSSILNEQIVFDAETAEELFGNISDRLKGSPEALILAGPRRKVR
jgi:hypothetical protein